MLLQTKKTWTICISTDEVLAYPDKEIMQTPTPYEQREHQLCFFFIQLNRQVSSVRKKSQCAFYVVICLPAPRANETKVVLFLKKTKSASPFCLSLSTKPHDSPIKYSYWYTSLLILLSPPVLPVAFCAATLSSFRATTRNPGKPTRDYVNKSPACSLWTPHRMRVTRLCSFFSAARRTNQEAPPLLSGYLARRLAPPSGAAELAALKQSSPLFLNRLASSRPDKGGGIATLHRKCPGHFAVRYPKIYRPISSFRAATRNPEIPGHGITQDARTVRHYSTHCHLQKLDPASSAG